MSSMRCVRWGTAVLTAASWYLLLARVGARADERTPSVGECDSELPPASSADEVAMLQTSLHANIVPERHRGGEEARRPSVDFVPALQRGNASIFSLHPAVMATAPLRPSSTGVQEHTGLITMYTDPGSNMYLLLDITDIMEEPGPAQVLVTAMASRGAYRDEVGQVATLHEPLEDTEDVMLGFKLASDNQSVDVLQPQISLRTSDPQTKEALERGISSPFVAGLPRQSRPRGSTAGNDRVFIDGFDLIGSGFFVSNTLARAPARLVDVKAYPDNIDITVEYALQALVEVTFSVTRLPRKPMKPRAGDHRLGYFTVDYVDLGVHKAEPHELKRGDNVDRDVSHIWRYNLAALPQHQIRIHIDPSVPERWRPYIKQGIEGWNPAFELIGYPNAMRGVLPTDKDWPSDFLPGDARYSTISWSIDVTGVYAEGVARIDPRSGEILKGDIIFTDGWVAAWLSDLDNLAPMQQLRSGHRREEWRSRHGRSARARHSAADSPYRAPRFDGPNLAALLGERGAGRLSLAMLQTAAAPDKQERIVGDGLRSIVMHETGHLLGLRHNFKASTDVSWECTQNVSCSAVHGLSSSVMDYVPTNIPAKGIDDVHLFSPVIGAYDKLAIHYGYKADASPAELKRVLHKAEAYSACLDGDYQLALDPLCEMHDLSADPLRYYEDQLRLLGQSLRRLLNSSVAPGEPYTNYGDAVYGVLSMAKSYGFKIIYWIGGVNTTYAYRGEVGKLGGAARGPIPATQQLKALTLLLSLMRPSESGLLPPGESLKYLVESTSDGVSSLDLRPIIRGIQQDLLEELLSSSRLQQVYAGEDLPAADGGPGLTSGNYLGTLVATIFSDAGPGLSSPSDWDLQALLAEGLKKLYTTTDLPAKLAAQVTHHMKNARERAGRFLELAEFPSKDQQRRSLLHEHVLLLRKELEPSISRDRLSELDQSAAGGRPRRTALAVAAAVGSAPLLLAVAMRS